MRVHVNTMDNWTLLDTLYPSEPLLSCAASELLHGREYNVRGSLCCLEKEINADLIDTDKCGELVSRLIPLLAKDLCIRESGALPYSSQELLDCRPLPVVMYLVFLFGGDCLNDSTKFLFRDWYIDFSHWITMSEKLEFDSEGYVRHVYCLYSGISRLTDACLRLAWKNGSLCTGTVRRPYSAAIASLESTRLSRCTASARRVWTRHHGPSQKL